MKKIVTTGIFLFHVGIVLCQNVGVGTTTPTTLFQVGNFTTRKNTVLSVSSESGFSTNPPGDRFSAIKLSHYTNNWGFSIESNDAPGKQGLSIKTHNDDSAGVTRMYMDRNNGFVGIGTITPAANLDLRSAGTDEGVTFNISNADQSHQLLFFPGRQMIPTLTSPPKRAIPYVL